MIGITNNTKLEVPMNVQRNKSLSVTIRLGVPDTSPRQYYNLATHQFKLKIVDGDGLIKLELDNNRFGVKDDFTRELVITSDETESFNPVESYYYDMMVVTPEGYKDYLMAGLVIIENRITT